MKQPIDQLVEAVKPTLATRDEGKITALFDRLIGYKDAEPKKVEAALGWGILVACEFKLQCSGKYLHWFLKHFPQSVIPVKVEYAGFLADSGKEDSATRVAREYLRLNRDCGNLSPEISKLPTIRLGVSKAFLLLTAAYTTMGARSYSGRTLKYASQFPLDPGYLGNYQREMDRLRQELQEPHNRELNARWEAFFKSGEGANELFELCKSKGYEILARRVDLLEGNLRFNPDFRVDAKELFLLEMEMQQPDGKLANLLA